MTDRFFTELLPILLKFPINGAIKVESCRMEYEAWLARGILHETIVAGTENWVTNHVPEDKSNFYPPAPHNFLREGSFLAYQPKDKAKLKVVSS